jgi:hypothetical protein
VVPPAAAEAVLVQPTAVEAPDPAAERAKRRRLMLEAAEARRQRTAAMSADFLAGS